MVLSAASHTNLSSLAVRRSGMKEGCERLGTRPDKRRTAVFITQFFSGAVSFLPPSVFFAHNKVLRIVALMCIVVLGLGGEPHPQAPS